MSTTDVYLEKVHIQNYLSLHNVELPLGGLTVLVGPNASGKSNILNALELLKAMMTNEEPPPLSFIKNEIWVGGANIMSFKFKANIDNKQVIYFVELTFEKENRISQEKLEVDGTKVISIKKGKGKVKDEDGNNEIDYKSKKLDLTSAGAYGDKPITNILNEFVGNWGFYNFDPDVIRSKSFSVIQVMEGILSEGFVLPDEFTKELHSTGGNLQYMLLYWYKNAPDRFDAVNQYFEKCSKFKIDVLNDGKELGFYEGYSNPIPIDKISDGTLRLLAYLVLLNQPELPPLIAIEEPERNLHPAWLSILSDILNQLSKRTQVIITTHSSQLLDTFVPQDLHENLNVLLLHNVFGSGTEVDTLKDISENRKGLQNWINEFGIGSAIFDSEILQDIMQGCKGV